MPRNLLFLLTDGGRARFVEQSPDSGDFVTIETLDHTVRLRQLRGELRASPPARTFSSTSPRRSSVGREDYERAAKEAFMAEVADRASELFQSRGRKGVFLAAPSRLIGVLRERLGHRAAIAGTLGKDLTKAPDHELGAWLDEAALGRQLIL
ncbi:MAG: host attachment protein [Caulobacter sp.]|nr:host attachment protein [Caulobacter sp.]